MEHVRYMDVLTQLQQTIIHLQQQMMVVVLMLVKNECHVARTQIVTEEHVVHLVHDVFVDNAETEHVTMAKPTQHVLAIVRQIVQIESVVKTDDVM